MSGWSKGGAQASAMAYGARARVASLLFVLLECAPAGAGTEPGMAEDHAAILEVGATEERELSERSSHVGPAVGIEVEPIENLLELEFGTSTYKSRGATHWDFDLALKRPIRLTGTIEIMPGVGPTWAHMTQDGRRTDRWGAEFVLDFFIWRTPRMGWYLEPSCGMSLAEGHEKSAALTGGLFFAVP